jgi:hypothetical protein
MLFGLLSRKHRRPRPVNLWRTQVQVERLETRDCPAAPVITAFSAVPLNVGNQVDLSGSVTDANPASVALDFSGVTSGTTTANANGHFDFVAKARALGTVSAVAQDGQNLTSNTATATFSVPVPGLTLAVTYGCQRTVTLSGKVTAPSAGSLTVTFAGVVTGWVTTNTDGTFTWKTQASALGKVQATTKDVWGQTSSAAQVTVSSAKPVISNFGASEGPMVGGVRWWTFEGEVTAPSPKGETVQFGGIPSLKNQTATVDSSGWFVLTIQLQNGENGTAWAQATDCWGQTSALATDWVSQTA